MTNKKMRLWNAKLGENAAYSHKTSISWERLKRVQRGCSGGTILHFYSCGYANINYNTRTNFRDVSNKRWQSPNHFCSRMNTQVSPMYDSLSVIPKSSRLSMWTLQQQLRKANTNYPKPHSRNILFAYHKKNMQSLFTAWNHWLHGWAIAGNLQQSSMCYWTGALYSYSIEPARSRPPLPTIRTLLDIASQHKSETNRFLRSRNVPKCNNQKGRNQQLRLCEESTAEAYHALLDAGLESRELAHVAGVQIQPPARRPCGRERGRTRHVRANAASPLGFGTRKWGDGGGEWVAARTRGGEEWGLDGEHGEAEGQRQAQQQRHRRPALRRSRQQVGPRHRPARRVGGGARPRMGRAGRGRGEKARRVASVRFG